jgi:hypothetical protein
MDGGGVVAALVAHHQRRLAGERPRIFTSPVDAVGDVRAKLWSCRFRHSRTGRKIGGVPFLAGFCLEPAGYGLQRRKSLDAA